MIQQIASFIDSNDHSSSHEKEAMIAEDLEQRNEALNLFSRVEL
jgi:hypothetical protein